jgi:hypothetical protein
LVRPYMEDLAYFAEVTGDWPEVLGFCLRKGYSARAIGVLRNPKVPAADVCQAWGSFTACTRPAMNLLLLLLLLLCASGSAPNMIKGSHAALPISARVRVVNGPAARRRRRCSGWHHRTRRTSSSPPPRPPTSAWTPPTCCPPSPSSLWGGITRGCHSFSSRLNPSRFCL